MLLEQFGTLDAANGGLTLVAGLVEGGNAANAGVDLLPGDSIVKAGTTRVECLDYDATVDALMALPPAPAPAGLMAVWKSTSAKQHRVDAWFDLVSTQVDGEAARQGALRKYASHVPARGRESGRHI